MNLELKPQINNRLELKQYPLLILNVSSEVWMVLTKKDRSIVYNYKSLEKKKETKSEGKKSILNNIFY